MKNFEKLTISPPIQIYVKIIEKMVSFQIKAGYYLELSTPEKYELVKSNDRSITKDKGGENITKLMILLC